MLSNFALVAGQVVTLFLLMGVGFVLAQLGKLYPDGVSQMSTLVLYVVTPCVIIHAFAIERTDGMVRLLLEFAAVYALSTLFCAAVALFCFRGEDPCRRGPMRFAMVYGNNGFMGLPLLLSILGEQAVIYGVVSVVVFNLLLWTHGVRTMGGRVTLRQALVSPATVGLAVGLPLFLTGGRLPSMVDSAVGFLADLNTPLAMIVIGAQMAGADLKRSFTSPRLTAWPPSGCWPPLWSPCCVCSPSVWTPCSTAPTSSCAPSPWPEPPGCWPSASSRTPPWPPRWSPSPPCSRC